MEKGFFHPDRGYWQTLSEPDPDILKTYPAGTVEVPLKPSALHTFDGVKWVPPTQDQVDAAKAEEIRFERDMKLKKDVDPVVSNPLRWADMTPQQQQSWADYRQALLDIPEQAGFPHDVTWPTKPE